MTRGRVLIAATTLVALVAASAAVAAPLGDVRMSGKVPGDDEAIVRLTTVVDSDGNTKTVKRFRFKKVAAICDGEAQRITLKTSGRVPVDIEERTFQRAFSGGVGRVRVEGTVSRTGTRVVGAFNAQRIAIEGLGTCTVGTQAFKVKALYKVK